MNVGEARRVVFFLSLEYGAKRSSSARRFGVADDRHHMSRCQTLNDLVVTVGLRRAAPLPCRKTVRVAAGELPVWRGRLVLPSSCRLKVPVSNSLCMTPGTGCCQYTSTPTPQLRDGQMLVHGLSQTLILVKDRAWDLDNLTGCMLR